MAIVEKKYLVSDAIERVLAKQTHSKQQISQFYTQVKICKEVRYRKIDHTFFKTVRTGSEVRKNIIDEEISHKSYQKAKEKKIGKMLKKSRYTLSGDFKHFTIDCYKKQLKGLSILEVSFKSLEKAERFVLPDIFQAYIQRDVSEDERYRDKNLALLGNPQKHPYNIYAIFKDIQKGRLENISTVIFPEMIVSDGVRIILYRLYHALERDREKLLIDNDIHALARFRRNLKELKIILEEYHHIFDKNMHKKVLSHLSMIEKSIAIDRDLSLIRANINLLERTFSEKELNTFIARLDKRIEEEKHKVKSFFKRREFTIIFRQVALLLKEQSNIHSAYYSHTTIEKVQKSSLNKRFNKLLFLSEKYEECHDANAYKKIRKALIKTRVILDNFSHLYDKNSYKKMQTLLTHTDMLLTEFINTKKRALIITTYISNANKPLAEQKKRIKKVQKRKKRVKKRLAEAIDKSMQLLRENSALFQG